jgi:hypothetical protein
MGLTILPDDSTEQINHISSHVKVSFDIYLILRDIAEILRQAVQQCVGNFHHVSFRR